MKVFAVYTPSWAMGEIPARKGRVMSEQQKPWWDDHLNAWIDRPDKRPKSKDKPGHIKDLCRRMALWHPDVLDKYPWRDILQIAQRNYQQGTLPSLADVDTQGFYSAEVGQ